MASLNADADRKPTLLAPGAVPYTLVLGASASLIMQRNNNNKNKSIAIVGCRCQIPQATPGVNCLAFCFLVCLENALVNFEARLNKPVDGVLLGISGAWWFIASTGCELPYTGVVQFCLRRELPYTGVVQLCLRRKLPVPGTKRGAILYLCGEY